MLTFITFVVILGFVTGDNTKSLHAAEISDKFIVNAQSNSPRFSVYWNVPSIQCNKYNITFDNITQMYGIIRNTGDVFFGDRITIMYEPVGLFPTINQSNPSEITNGGVPQEGNLTLHLDLFKKKLEQLFPDEQFDGLGILDFESWRPIWRQNWPEQNVYRALSREIERKLHPSWPDEKIEKVAKSRFEEAAIKFLKETIVAAKESRPFARWGYYGLPYCFNTHTQECEDIVRKENDQIQSLWNTMELLLPSIYLFKADTSQRRQEMITGRINEAKRLKCQSDSDLSILPYSWFKYHDKQDEYIPYADLYGALSQSYDAGLDGLVIWGGYFDLETREDCEAFQIYVSTILGPAVKKFTMKYT